MRPEIAKKNPHSGSFCQDQLFQSWDSRMEVSPATSSPAELPVEDQTGWPPFDNFTSTRACRLSLTFPSIRPIIGDLKLAVEPRTAFISNCQSFLLKFKFTTS